MGIRYADDFDSRFVSWWFEGCAAEAKEDGVDGLDESSKRGVEDRVEKSRRVPDLFSTRPRPRLAWFGRHYLELSN